MLPPSPLFLLPNSPVSAPFIFPDTHQNSSRTGLGAKPEAPGALWSLTLSFLVFRHPPGFPTGMKLQLPLLLGPLRAHFLPDTAISWLDLKWQRGSWSIPKHPGFSSWDFSLVSRMSPEGVVSCVLIQGCSARQRWSCSRAVVGIIPEDFKHRGLMHLSGKALC